MSETNGAIAPKGLEPIGECTVLRQINDQPGVATLEGDLIPLLSGDELKSHMIVMYPGQYCDAHPHPTESIIYTVSGRWVFCTTEDDEQVRTVIGEGDLFHMKGGVPTGFEVPFEEPAVILIVKSGSLSYDEMIDGMVEAKEILEAQASEGEPFTYAELDEDHPARVFAREVAGRDPGDG